MKYKENLDKLPMTIYEIAYESKSKDKMMMRLNGLRAGLLTSGNAKVAKILQKIIDYYE